jgi:heme exporter protein D
MKKRHLLIGIFVILIIGAGIVVANSYFKKAPKKSFDTDVIFLKVGVIENGTSIHEVTIENFDSEAKYFRINPMGLADFVNISEREVRIEGKESRKISLVFCCNKNIPGVYIGKLVISSGTESRDIPIIFEVQSRDVFFDSNINLFPSGGDISVDQTLNSEIKIFDLAGLGENRINLSYSVKNFNGKTILSGEESLIIDGKLDYSRSINLPEDSELGEYVFIAVIQYGDSFGTSSATFRVVEEPVQLYAEKGIIWVIAIFAFFFFMFAVLFVYSVSSRDRLLREMNNQYRREMRRQVSLIKESEKEADKLTLQEKKEYKKELKRIKKERLNALRKERDKEVKAIRKRKKGTNYEILLKKWRSKGYNTRVLEQKYKIPSVSEIKKKVSSWKKKGYDTSVLDKK